MPISHHIILRADHQKAIDRLAESNGSIKSVLHTPCYGTSRTDTELVGLSPLQKTNWASYNTMQHSLNLWEHHLRTHSSCPRPQLPTILSSTKRVSTYPIMKSSTRHPICFKLQAVLIIQRFSSRVLSFIAQIGWVVRTMCTQSSGPRCDLHKVSTCQMAVSTSKFDLFHITVT